MDANSIDRMLAASSTGEYTTAMIALVPRADQAAQFAVSGMEPASELHVTLLFLGEAENFTEADELQITASVARAAQEGHPIEATAWGIAQFNPHTAETAAVYMIGGAGLEDIQMSATAYTMDRYYDRIPTNHRPWIPHMTIGYNMSLSRLHNAGQPITFDRVRVAFRGDYEDFALGTGEEVESEEDD
jgi:2'-5' RNA ligase